MKILSLDLATATGWAYGKNGETPKVGTVHLAASKEITAWGKKRLTRRQDPRCARLYSHLVRLSEDALGLPDIIVFEDVEFMSYTQQCQLWSSLRATVWLFAHFQGVQLVDCLNVGSLKKFGTGFGNADKALMAKYLSRRHPEISQVGMDDNGVDAAWLWFWAAETFARFRVTDSPSF